LVETALKPNIEGFRLLPFFSASLPRRPVAGAP